MSKDFTPSAKEADPFEDAQYAVATEETRRTSFWGKIWDTADLPKPERKLLFKVDAIILTFASLGYFIKNLDQTNVNNAFVSGMKEDLNMYSNELVTSTSIWTVGYVIGQIPSNILLTRVSPRYVIPALEFGWGIATLGCFAIKDVKALYALRFLVGLFESGFYPGMHYILGGWYTPRELGKRASIFWTAGSLGQLFSGFLQAAAYKNLNGVHGHAGWRWLFVIDAIITLPIALAGFIFLPHEPQSEKRIWWLSEEQQVLAAERMTRLGRKGKASWSAAKLKRLLFSWHTYVLPMAYVIWNNGFAQAAMPFWLKSFNAKVPPVPGTHYSVPQINTLPMPTTAVFIVAALAMAWLSDGFARGRRWPFIYIGAVITLAVTIPLRVIPVYHVDKARFALYYLQNVGAGAGPLILSWINEICSGDLEKRAILVAAGNDFAYVVQAVAPNFIWKTTDFPAARKGYTWVIVLNILLILWVTLILVLLRRDKRLNDPTGTIFGPIPRDDDLIQSQEQAHEETASSSQDEEHGKTPPSGVLTPTDLYDVPEKYGGAGRATDTRF